jgi:uncharacterized protein (TIGR02996 family)
MRITHQEGEHMLQLDSPERQQWTAFALNILADPAGATDRLVFADWLEEQQQDVVARHLRQEGAVVLVWDEGAAAVCAYWHPWTTPKNSGGVFLLHAYYRHAVGLCAGLRPRRKCPGCRVRKISASRNPGAVMAAHLPGTGWSCHSCWQTALTTAGRAASAR